MKKISLIVVFLCMLSLLGCSGVDTAEGTIMSKDGNVVQVRLSRGELVNATSAIQGLKVGDLVELQQRWHNSGYAESYEGWEVLGPATVGPGLGSSSPASSTIRAVHSQEE